MNQTNVTSVATALGHAITQLNYAKDMAEATDEAFTPELAGMIGRLGVIASALTAGFYTTTTTSSPVEQPLQGIRLTKTTQAKDGAVCYPVAGHWMCCSCRKGLEVGDVVNNLTASLKHIDCNRPQG